MHLLISVVRRRHYSRLYTFKSQNMHCTRLGHYYFFNFIFRFNICIKHDRRRHNINEGSGAIRGADNDPCIIDYDAGKFLIPSIRRPNKQTDGRCSGSFIQWFQTFFFFFASSVWRIMGEIKNRQSAQHIIGLVTVRGNPTNQKCATRQ